MELTDTHCHLDFDRFDKDRDDVFKRAIDAGVTKILVPGIDIKSSQKAVALADKYDGVYAAVGVHPNSGTTWNASTRKQLEQFSQHPKAVAIGEIGLDYYREWTPHNIQHKIFAQQLELAANVELPVIIHCRDAFPDIQEKLETWVNSLETHSKLVASPGVFHSFSGNIDEVQQIVSKNFYIGISGPITYKNAGDLQEAVSKMPVEKLLIETDAPFLTPQPRRGKRNEPAFVKFVAEKIAQLRGMSLVKIGEVTFENSNKIFAW